MKHKRKILNTKIMAVIYSALFIGGILFISGNPLNAQGKNCNTTCELYYDCFSIAYLKSKDGQAPDAKAKLQREKQNIIKKCVKECVAKKNEANILECYVTRTPTIPVCKAFYTCAVKFYKTDQQK